MPQAQLGTDETLQASAPDLASLPTVDVQGEQPAQADLLDAPTKLTRFGHYVLLHELGRGGMGVVYAAYDEKLDRKVAIKVLRAQGDPAAQRRLVREAQGLARLSHPNVVQIYEIGDIDGQGFLAMEFIDGSTLRSWRVEQPRTFAEILAAALAAGRGLAAAHAKSLVHRDFKPDNVMIHRDGRVLVTDFGLVRGDETAETPDAPAPTGELRAELTRVGSVMGTPGYMPPEQFSGRETDARSDQFSFCVSLWEMLFAARPFTGEDSRAVEAAILAGKITEPARHTVPTWLRAVLVRGLACEPIDRWPTMDELLAALRRDPTPRRRAMWASSGVLTVALALAGWTVAATARQREATRTECEHSAHEIDADWNDAVAARLEQAFLATGKAHAATDWAHSRPWMDNYVREWAAIRERTCLETRLEERRSPASHAAITACLDERRATFLGVLDVWAEMSPIKLRMAAVSAASLPPLSLCTDEAHLARLARPPEQLRPQVEDLQLRLERVKALRLAGVYDAALPQAELLVPQAEALAWLPLLAQLRLEIGFDQAELGRYVDARSSVEQSFLDAAASGDELGMLSAATKLSHTIGSLLGQHETGHYWGKIAFALLSHLGMEGSVAEASLRNSVGSVYLKQAEYEPALAFYRRALSIYESKLGPGQPAVSASLNNIATVLRSQGKHAESLEPYTRALEIRETTLGPENPAIAYPLHGLGLSYLALGDHARARGYLERAVALRALTGEPARLADSRFGLARVMWAADERAPAHALALIARQGFLDAGPGSEKDLARVDAWLREHEPP